MTDLDTLRWGDAKTVQIPAAGGLGPAFAFTSNQQLAQARWRWPLMWGLRIIILPHFNADETATFTVQVMVTIGSGQNSTTAVFTYTVAPTAGVYPVCVNDLQQLPAQDVQVTCKVTSGAATASAAAETLEVGCYLAPLTEPHGTTRLYEWMMTPPDRGARWTTEHHGSDPDGPQPGTGQGFPINPDPLYYQRR
jgi:hypothetical protein